MKHNELYFNAHIGSVEIPRWVKYIAQDYSGKWWGYALKPQQSEDDYGVGLWDMSSKTFHGSMFKECIFLAYGLPPSNWKSELWTIHWV